MRSSLSDACLESKIHSVYLKKYSLLPGLCSLTFTIDAAMKYIERGVSAGIAPRAIRNRNTAKIRSKTIAGRSEIAPYP